MWGESYPFFRHCFTYFHHRLCYIKPHAIWVVHVQKPQPLDFYQIFVVYSDEKPKYTEYPDTFIFYVCGVSSLLFCGAQQWGGENKKYRLLWSVTHFYRKAKLLSIYCILWDYFVPVGLFPGEAMKQEFSTKSMRFSKEIIFLKYLCCK